MSWLKDVIVDILVTVVIVIAVLVDQTVLTGVVWAYTGLLLLVKTFVLFGGDFMNLMGKTKTDAPEWFNHLLYATNTGVLFYFQWWYAGGCWLLIWILSYLTQRKINKAK